MVLRRSTGFVRHGPTTYTRIGNWVGSPRRLPLSGHAPEARWRISQ
jgi:hypothetical protein